MSGSETAASAEVAAAGGLASSLGFSAFIVLLAFAVMLYLVIKGVPMWLNAIIATAIIGLSTSEGPIGILLGSFSQGAGLIIQMMGVVYLMGMVFADAMTVSGCGTKLGIFLVDKLSIKAAPFCIMIPTLLLALGGVDSYMFLMAPIAFAVLKRADLPRAVGVVVLCGTYTLIGFLMPGSTGMINVLAANLYGTELFAGADVGILMMVIGIVLNALYYIWLCNDYRKKGIGYTPTELEKSIPQNEQDLPSFVLSLIPILIAFGGAFVFQLGMGLSSSMTAVLSQGAAVLFIYITNWKRMSKEGESRLNQIAASLQKAFTFVMLAGILMGFTSALGTTTLLNSLTSILTGIKGNAYVVAVLAAMLLVFITGAGMTALTIFASTVGKALIAGGADAGMIHRLTMAASTAFDSTPWSMTILLNFQVMDVKLKEAYKHVLVVQVLITTIYTLVGMLYAILFY